MRVAFSAAFAATSLRLAPSSRCPEASLLSKRASEDHPWAFVAKLEECSSPWRSDFDSWAFVSISDSSSFSALEAARRACSSYSCCPVYSPFEEFLEKRERHAAYFGPVCFD